MMGKLDNLFSQDINAFAKEYIQMLAHLTPYGEIEKDLNNMIITLKTSNGSASTDLKPLYQTWKDTPKDERESVVLKLVGNQLSEANNAN